MPSTLRTLREIIEDRDKNGHKDTSYIAKMLNKGHNKIAQKVGEEATEVVIASLTETREDLIAESADLLFHLSLLWYIGDVTHDEIMEELTKRMGVSGIEEKASREE